MAATTAGTSIAPETERYRVTGMDCASCAAKIEKAARAVTGVEEVQVSIGSQTMTLRADDPRERLPEVGRAVTGLGYQLEHVDAPGARAGRDDDDDLPKDLAHITPAYRRALWTVVLLNVGYGLVEIVGGFIAGSQALK